MGCSSKKEDNPEKKLTEVESTDFPTFNNKDVFIQTDSAQLNFYKEFDKTLGLKSQSIFICLSNYYFVKESKYCMYFEGLWIQKVLESTNKTNSNIFSLYAEKAYSDKIFSNFLFYQTVFSLQNSDFILKSNILNWLSQENLLDSPLNSKHEMSNINGDIIQGQHLILNYKSNEFTMDNVSVVLKAQNE